MKLKSTEADWNISLYNIALDAMQVVEDATNRVPQYFRCKDREIVLDGRTVLWNARLAEVQ
jgi:hypothetical protein